MINKVEMDIGDGRILSLETGRVAREAGGAVIVRVGDTMILATATASDKPREGIDFLPLLVDFEEKLYAVGKIPGGFFKREGRPTERAVLTARLIDRPIRPLFPKGYRNDIQIVITPLSVDQENPPDVLAMIGASAALSISEIPFEGPAGAVRVGRVGDKFILNPTVTQMKESDLDLVITSKKDVVMMLEAGAEEVSEDVVLKGIEFGHNKIREFIKLQEELVSIAGKPKKVPELYGPSKEIEKLVTDLATKKLEEALHITEKDKQRETLDHIEEEMTAKVEEDEKLKAIFEESPADVKEVLDSIKKKIVRKNILDKGKRPDGRGVKDIRPVSCEIGILPRAHGAGLFTRGGTQVLTVATLGAIGEMQRIEGLEPEESTKRYLHHYNFPAFSVGEVKPIRGPGRREIGHGALAERALLPVVPQEEKFPYTIRLVSEVLASNGSTSMASVCGSTLALMDAGVPIESAVAGISVGLIKEGNKSIILSDIQGLEDQLGDMDFKVAGTRKGITSIQLDLKIKGITFPEIKKALAQNKESRNHILDIMEKSIAKPREEISPYAPKIISMAIDPSKIGLVIGPGGKTIKKIIEETGAAIDIEDDGRVFISTPDAKAAEAAKKRVEEITFEAKVGDIYLGKVTRIVPFGAFVEIVPGKEGLLHISQISERRIGKVEDVLSIGDEVLVKVVEIDEMGRLNLSKKAVSPEEERKGRKR